ncbi:hypothetical protein GCM10023217_33860 [Gordonia alkaliphila]|uniref:Uncharacterized protein n=1 Tax=Gordonia alkaliphila TaxID=1053547 RepID=A0ABP8ZJW2_9ACTN
MHLGCRAVNIGDPQPKGVLDEVTAYRGGLVKVRGWSFEPDQTPASLRVHVYIGPQPGRAVASGAFGCLKRGESAAVGGRQRRPSREGEMKRWN